jgi:Nucleotide modification associated domain 2
MIFLMEVAQIVPIEEYFTDKNFSSKKPENESGPIRCQTCSSEADYISLVGDNIYQKNKYSQGFRQTPNIFHKNNPHTIKHDTEGKNVLIANNFFYFGGNGFIPNGGWGKLTTTTLPEARQFYCPDDFQSKLIEYFNAHEIHPGRHGLPTDWPPKCPPTTSLNQ